ncbi:MAG TPA: hypothetical protein VG713_04005, partial [Pirellulales bacterium]|nr:hypothetical protein [Pirellulales bacterium]
MPKPTDIRLVEISHEIERIGYRTPIKFGGRVVTDAVLLHVRLQVETRDGRRGQGFGSMPMSNAWAWPSQTVSGDDTLWGMCEFARRAIERAGAYRGLGHPLEITHDLAHDHATIASEVSKARTLAEPIPRLAQLVAASPVEAAVHDAYGKVLGQNSYNVLGPEFANRDIGSFLNADFAGEYLDRYTLRQPKARMPLYHLVGALDPLSDVDVVQPVGDGLPETLGQWIAADGLTHLKIKLNGDDLDWDVDRVVRVEQVAAPVQAQ